MNGYFLFGYLLDEAFLIHLDDALVQFVDFGLDDEDQVVYIDFKLLLAFDI